MSASHNAALAGVRKIAVLRPNAIGDFIFSLPCLHALKSTYPEARILYIGRQWHADFLANRPGPVDQVAVLPPCPGIGVPPDADVDPEPVRRFLRRMQDEEFDLVLQIYGGGHHSNPFVMQFDAGLAIGMRAAGTAALDRWVPYRDLQNRRLQMLEVASLVGANILCIGQELQVTERDRREAEEILPASPERLVVLQPAASDVRRCWPAEHFAAVGDALAKAGARIAVNGTQQEAPVVRQVIERMRQPAIDLSGKLSPSGLCGLLERAALLVSNDTGPLHLGLAIGTPSVGIYWLTNLIESGPLQQSHHRPVLALRTECPVCGIENLKQRCPHDVSFVDDVAVDEVMDLALGLLREQDLGRQ